jgi:hypothetical protein
MEIASKPVNEFNGCMREIMAGTNKGKKIVKEIMGTIKRELHEDEFNNAMNELNNKKTKDYYTLDEIMFDSDIELDEDDDVFESDDLF